MLVLLVELVFLGRSPPSPPLLPFVSHLFLGAPQTGSKRLGPEQWSRAFTQLDSHLQAEPFYSVDYNAKLTWPCTNHCHCRPSLLVALTQNRAKQQVQRYRCTTTSWGYTSTLRETTEGLPDPFRNDSHRAPSRASGNVRYNGISPKISRTKNY